MIEFSPTGYEAVIAHMRTNGFEFIGFGEAAARRKKSGKLCLLRHDVDVSMDHAVAMGRVEARLGVHSTYFVMLRSPLYNLFSRHAANCLRELVALGHSIGLHYDAVFDQGPERTLEQWIAFELETLATMAGVSVNAFSLHQPTPEIMDKRIELAGVVNTYHPLHLDGFKYISDSNRVWREYDPIQLVDAGFDHIHVLLHPVWWMCDRPVVEDCWDRAIEMNFESAQRQLLATERAYGARRKISLTRS